MSMSRFGLSVVIHGQRAGDWPTSDPSPLEYDWLEPVAPLWTVSRADVQAAVDNLGIELSHHYGNYPSSLDCSVCPSPLTTSQLEIRSPPQLGTSWDVSTRRGQRALSQPKLHGAGTRPKLSLAFMTVT